ncbi:MAG: hypothetical protein OER92_03495 [Alphaproteobacteria bacterium]|nr:hypothetical protein [Alphaproteobacteria bacterium]
MSVKVLIVAGAVAVVGFSAVAFAPQTHAAGGTTAIETIVPTDISTTWDLVVAEFNEGDFAINATIKESSTIRILLQSKIPSTWVDCGNISVSSNHATFGHRNYNFLAANSARYLVADEKVDELIDVERRTSLNALANIKLTPKRQGTLVSIDAHYVMKFRTREFGNNITPRSVDKSMDFDSAGQASTTEEIREGSDTKLVTIDCRPTGELERRLVTLLERTVTTETALLRR